MNLVTHLRGVGENVAAIQLDELQAVVVEDEEMKAVSPEMGEKIGTLEMRLRGTLGATQLEMFAELDRLEAQERRRVMRAVFWRAFRLGVQVGAWSTTPGSGEG